MSSLQFYNYPGPGEDTSESFHYSQSVVIGDIVKCSGQGGWDDTGKLVEGSEAQIKQAFANIDKALQAAGLRGWEDIYSVRSYHSDVQAQFPMVVKQMKERIPGHRPIWTCIETKLALPGMEVEIEVEAYAKKE